MLQFENVSKLYGNHVAVQSLNLHIPKGQMFGFLGSNGAGKTTTIKMMTGLVEPTSGRILIGGYDIKKYPLEVKRLFGYIPDRPYLYEKLSAREFITFMAELYDVTANLKERIEYWLERFDLHENADKPIQSYSHGMKQKTAIIGALIHQPQVLILDEPTVGLDPHGAKRLKEVLTDFVAQGNTVFMSTHILEIAERMCSQVAILQKGTLLLVSTVKELQAQKSNQSLEEIFLELVRKSDQPEENRKL